MFQRIAKSQVAPAKNLIRSFATVEANQFSKINANVDYTDIANKYPLSQLSTLPNGVRITSENVPGEMASVGVFINAGSRYENEKNNGVAHFVEHLIFKGTGKRTRVQLEKEIEAIGGELNAYTSRDQTVFLAKVFKKDVNQAVDILGDILLNSKFSTEAINAERGVILREMQDVESRLQEVVFDRLHQTAYRTTSLSRTILGPKENINSISREDIEQYVQTHYVGPRMVVAAAGEIDHAAFAAAVEKNFAPVPKRSTNNIDAVKGQAFFTGSEIRIRDDDMPAAHIAYAFETAGWKDADHYPLMILQMMLGSYNESNTSSEHSSSPMVAFAAANHSAESITPFNTVYSDTGLFGLYLIADAFDLDVETRHMADTLTAYAFNVNPVALGEAKNKLKLALFSQLETPGSVCDELGRQILNFNRRIHPNEVLARIDAVTEGDVQAVVKRFFYDQDPAIASIGPIHELPDYNAFRACTYSRAH